MHNTRKKRYIAFIVLIVLIIGTATTLTTYAVNELSYTATRINVAGRQRMTFQRSLLILTRFHSETDQRIKDNLKPELESLLADLLENHQSLARGNPSMGLPPTDSPMALAEINGPADHPEQGVGHQLDAYVTFARAHFDAPPHAFTDPTHGGSDPDLTLAKFEQTIPRLLDQLVAVFREEGIRHVEKLRFIFLSAGIAVIIAIILAALTLLRPIIIALSRESEHLHAVLNNMVDGLITIDRRGNIETFNPAAERIFGYEAREVLGVNVSILLPSNERTAHEGYVEQSTLYASRIINRARDLWGQRKDGTLFPMELSVARLHYGGDHSRFVGIFRDITERKGWEQRLIEERQAAEAAREEAEIANAAKSKFLSSMSHELRTPMNAILGFGQLMAADTETPLAEKHRTYVDYILTSGNHLLGLIREVLDLATIESGRLQIDIEAMDPGTVINTTIEMAEIHARKYQVELINHCKGVSLPVVLGDRMRFSQVLLNFLTNAIKYNRPGGQVILNHEIIEGHFLRLVVTDTGPGIEASKLPHLFTPFHRLGLEDSGIEGSGIGLVIAKEFVALMNGNLGYETEAGKGSSFWFEVPLAERHLGTH